jgi:UrcA family protein
MPTKTKTTITTLALAAALVSALAGQASANAPSNPEMRSQKVSYADLNLSREKDTETLLRRIRRAAMSVCSGGDSRLDQISDNYHACVRTASYKAVASLHQPMITATYDHEYVVQVAQK